MARVKARIRPDGSVEIDINGVVGPGCTKISKILQEALGNEVESDLKTEYFQEELVEELELYQGEE